MFDFSIDISKCSGIIGQIEIDGDKYLLFVEKSNLVLDAQNLQIYKLEKVKCMNLSVICSIYDQEDLINDQIKELVFNCSEFVNDIYFLSKTVKNFINFLNECPFFFSDKKIDNDKYLWNKFLIESFKGRKNDSGLLHLYNGWFEMKACSYYNYFIMSFISSDRVGPRYFSRGVDSDGNVSNFVKTRYFVQQNNEIVIDVIIYRGSVPLYWQQTGSLRELQYIEKDNFLACFKHFYHNFNEELDDFDKDDNTKKVKDDKSIMMIQNQLNEIDRNDNTFDKSITHFNNILVVNLLSNKKDEKKLSDLYIDLLKNLHIRSLTFNLNKYHLNFKKMKKLFLEELHHHVMKIQENMLNRNDKLSKIIFRVNCLDCLDRTNLASYLICDYFHTQQEIPKDHLKSLFKENGNALSMFNAGSNALKNELAVKEKRSIMGLMDDFLIFTKRVIHDKFNDKQKMEYIDLVLGKNSSKDDGAYDQRYTVKFHANNCTENNFLLINMRITSRKELKDLKFESHDSTSIVIICINKIVSSLKSVFSDESITYTLQDFILVSKKSYFNNHILIFSRIEEEKGFTNIEFIEKKQNLQFTKKNCFSGVEFFFREKKFIIYNIIYDKLTDFSFFNENNWSEDDVFIISGIFFNENYSDLFDSLDCNYIENQNNNQLKIAFKGSVSGKYFQEYSNMTFFTFTN